MRILNSSRIRFFIDSKKKGSKKQGRTEYVYA